VKIILGVCLPQGQHAVVYIVNCNLSIYKGVNSMPTLPSIEVVVTLRLAFDVSAPYEGVGANKESYSVCSLTGDGSMAIGSEAVPVHRFQVSRFKRGDNDQLFNQMLTLKRGDRVRVSMALEVRPYSVVKAGKVREHWAIQAGQPYSLRVLERAQVGELIEV
jgi:hypothetical protein